MIKYILLLFLSIGLSAQDLDYEQVYSSQITPRDIALRYMGSTESRGDVHSKDVLFFLEFSARLGNVKNRPLVTKDETPWCAAFVVLCLAQAGYWELLNRLTGYDYFRARAFTKLKDYYPSTDIPSQLELGDLVIFKRGSGGHIGFFEAYDINTNRIRILGGNQSNTVSETLYLPVKDFLTGIKYNKKSY